MYFLIILPSLFLFSVRKRIGFRRVFQQWFSSFKQSKRDAIMGSMVVQALLGFSAYVSLTLVFFVYLSHEGGPLKIIEGRFGIALEPLQVSMLTFGILIPLFVGMFIHNTQGMIVGAYSPLLVTVFYVTLCDFPDFQEFNIYCAINVSSFLIGWAATGVFHPKRRLGYFLSHFKILNEHSDVVDVPRIKDGIANVCKRIYGENMIEYARETGNVHVVGSGVTHLGDSDFEFHYNYNSNLQEVKKLLEPLVRKPKVTQYVETLFETPFILQPSHLVKISDILPTIHKDDYFLKDSRLYKVKNVEKGTLKALDLSTDSRQLMAFTGDNFIMLLKVTATNSLNTFFYTLGKLITRIVFVIDKKGAQILIFSYEDSPGLRWPTFRLSVIANRIHQDVQELLETMKLKAESVSGNLPVTIRHPNRAIGLVCFGVRQLPIEKMSVKFESEISKSYKIAESYIEKETRLDRIRRSLITKVIAFLSISGGELLILLTDLLP